jgi:hypothetical protein
LSSNEPYPIHFAYHWLHPDSSIAVFGGLRSEIIPALPPRDSRYFVVRIQVPDRLGRTNCEPALVRERARWIDRSAYGGLHPVEVTAGAPVRPA